LAVVPRLRLISAALALGPSEADVVPASEPALEAFLASIPSITRLDAATASRAGSGAHELFGAIRSFDAEQLHASFEDEWAELGPLLFVSERAAPFLVSVGDAWERGELHVRHEHFASACLGDFLRTARKPMDDRATGPVVVLSTLPDELHGLGLQMAAVVSAAAGWRVLMLGTNTPLD
jgi:methanogenic corrinoid protein MtbC1